MMTYSDAIGYILGIAPRKHERHFSENQPKPKMPVVTKIERVQPFCTGINEKGEFVWEGREMPRWQMEMLRVAVDFFSEFFKRWIEVAKFESKDIEFSQDADMPTKNRVATKQWLEKTRRMYDKPRVRGRKAKGD